MNVPLIRLCDADEARLRSIAAHEAGHWVVGSYFGLDPTAFIGGPSSGICRSSPGTAFENCTATWGGIVAEDLLGCRHPERTLPTVPLSAETFRAWLLEMMIDGLEQVRSYSAPDVLAIKDHPRWLEAAKVAFLILDSRRDALATKADNLVAAFRPRFKAALVRNDFRADEADCLAARW